MLAFEGICAKSWYEVEKVAKNIDVDGLEAVLTSIRIRIHTVTKNKSAKNWSRGLSIAAKCDSWLKWKT